MGLSRSELVTLKAKIKAEMQRRNGIGPSNRLWTPSRAYGSVSQFAGGEYDFIHTPTKDDKIYSEYGRKTIDLLMQIYDIAGLESTVTGNPIPKTWNSSLIAETDRLSQEQFNAVLLEALNPSSLRCWRQNACYFADREDLYSLHQKAADVIVG